MATLREIRSAMLDDLSAQGMSSDELCRFSDQFDSNARITGNLLVTTDVEMEECELYAYVDQLFDGSYVSMIRRGRSVKRHYK